MVKGKRIVIAFIVMLGMSITAGWAQEEPMFGPGADLKGELTIEMHSYTPKDSTPADRWPPPKYLLTILEEYKKIHPDVKITVIKDKGGAAEAATWIRTRLMGGEAPEVFWGQYKDAAHWARSGLIVSMDPYLAMPNPYVPGNKKWIDIFDPSILEIIKAPDGKQYTINGDLVETCLFYNADIFKELGLTEPKTWEDLTIVLGKIESAGYIPMSWGGSSYLPYLFLTRFVFYSLYSQLLDQFDVIPEEKSGTVTLKEFALAWKKGIETVTSDRYRTVLQLQKDLSKYWSPDYLGLDTTMAYEQFITGKAAMYLDGSWQVKPVRLDHYREFNWGMMPFPPVTSKTTPYASEPGVLKGLVLGGCTGGFSFNVPVSAKEKGLLEEAVDFLMFLSAPQNAGPLIADLGSFVPCIKGTETLEQFFGPDEAVFFELIFPWDYSEMTRELRDLNFKVWQQFLGDQISIDEALSQYKKNIDNAVDRLIEESNWDFSEYGVK